MNNAINILVYILNHLLRQPKTNFRKNNHYYYS